MGIQFVYGMTMGWYPKGPSREALEEEERWFRCSECSGPLDDRTRAGMKCGPCAYGSEQEHEEA